MVANVIFKNIEKEAGKNTDTYSDTFTVRLVLGNDLHTYSPLGTVYKINVFFLFDLV